MDPPSPDSTTMPRFSASPTATRTTLVGVGCIFTAIGILTMLLRALTLIFRHRPLGWDDACMALGFLASIGFTTASFISVYWGVGRENTDTPPSIPEHWPLKAIQAVYVIEILYYIALLFIKMSILCLYLRLSSNIRNRFWTATLVTITVIVVQFISTIVIVGVQCNPTHHYWNRNTSGDCVNITAFFYATSIFTIITDVIILSLPIPMLIKLQQPRRQKLGLLATFLVGAVATLASCIRLYSVRIYTESAEALKDAAPIDTWSFIEIYLAMLCASVPAFRPLFKDLSKFVGWCRMGGDVEEKEAEGFEKQERDLPNMKELPPIPEDLLVKIPEPAVARAPRMSHSKQELDRSFGHAAYNANGARYFVP